MAASDEPVRKTRRRGEALEQAIFAAVLDEIRAVGYPAVSLDGIARRAGVGRMSLYRRWSGKPDLVSAAVRACLPALSDPPSQGALRGLLIDALAEMFSTRDGVPVLALHIVASMTADQVDQELIGTIRGEALEPRLARLRAIFASAGRRGELHEDADLDLLARAGPAVLFQQTLLTGKPPTRTEVADVVDGLLLPAAMPGSRDG